MWLPDLADDGLDARRPVPPRRAAGADRRGCEHAAGRRTAHAPAPPGVVALPRLGDVRRRAARGPSVQLYLKGFPDRRPARPHGARIVRPDRAGRSEHLAEHDLVVWRFPEDPQLPALPVLLASPLAPRRRPGGGRRGSRAAVRAVRHRGPLPARGERHPSRRGCPGRRTDRVRQASRCRLGRRCRRTAPRALVHDGTGAAAPCRRAARRRPGAPGVVDARRAGSDADGRGSPA